MAILSTPADSAEGSPTPDPAKVSAPVRYWMGEISAARAREKDFRKEGRRVLEIYNGDKKDSTPFNILYSNTETLLPALYNNQPRPVVQRRFKDEDPLGKAASAVGKRTLEYLLDTNGEEYSPFDSVMADAVLDALLPGRGATIVNYEAETPEVAPGQYAVKDETICYESLKWDRWIFGYAKKWCRVPWVALEYDVTKNEATRLFGAEKAGKLKYTAENLQDDKESELPKDIMSEEQDVKTCKMYKIWDKAGGRKVRFIAESYREDYLKVEDDPLELTGFYPIPEPMRFLRKSNDLMPTAIYVLYENQAKELNRITTRINRIVEALKVRGVYDSTVGELADLLKKDDNAMVPAENVAALQDSGLDKALWFVPIEKLVTVVQQLFIAREACKKVIYEITGISDILRGASQASETLGAQEIKQQWATLRLKRLQKEVARYARDLLRITVEIAGKHFQVETFKSMTMLSFPMEEEKKAIAGQLAKMRAINPQAPPDPRMVQVLQSPSWEQIIGELKDDKQRQYHIDIETNSTVDPEATEDHKEITDLLTAMGQTLSGLGPLILSGSMPFGAAQAILLTITRRFRFGDDIEDQIKQMQAPKPPDDGKAAAAAAKNQLDQQKAAHDAQMAQQQQQQDAAQLAHEQQLEIMKFQFEQRTSQETAAREHTVKMAELEAQKAMELAKLSSQRATEEMKAKYAQETELKKAALDSATKIQVAEISAKASQAAAQTSAEATTKSAETSAQAKITTAQPPEGLKTMLADLAKVNTELLDAINTPVVAERGGDGKVKQFVRKKG